MKSPDLSKWDCKPELEGVLFFAQLIDELLFDYTIDTYKIPALDSRLLALELLSSIVDYESKILKHAALKPITMELVDRIKKDPAIREIFQDYFEEFIKVLSKEQSISHIKNQILLFINKIREKYVPTLITILKDAIINRKEKEKITRLTGNYLIELINTGYSPQFIYFESNKFFFTGQYPKKINDPQIIDSYFNLFTLQTKKFNVMYRVSKNFGTIKEYARELGIEYSESCPILKFNKKSEKVELLLDSNEQFPCYLIIKDIESLDPNKAKTDADAKLFLIDSLAKYHVHRRELKRGNDALVYSTNQKEFHVLKKPKPAVMKRPDRIAEKLSDLVKDTLLTITSENLDHESFLRLIRAFLQHNTAVRSENPESQLLEFWAAIEVLFPPSSEEADRITQISDSMTPFIFSEYAAKLATDLLLSLRKSRCPEALELFSKIPEGENEIEKCLSLFSIETNEPVRRKLYQLFEWHPLLKNRIYYLNKRFSSADIVLKTLNNHIQRVSWQIRRIYRTRNLIIHSGKSVPFIDILIENLHSYLDRILDILNEKISRSVHDITIDQILLEIKLEAESHLHILEKLKSTKCTSDNYKLILFGNK